MGKNIIITVPATYFAKWKVKDPFDARVARYMGMHDGTTPRKPGDPQGGEWQLSSGKPWYWTFMTPMGHPKEIELGISVCFISYKNRLIGYFDVVGTGTGRDFWADYDEELAKRPDANTKCVALANFHPGNYGEKIGFQGFSYTELRP